MSVLPVMADAYHETPLPFPAIVFPLIALGVFLLLGFVAWSYRDVANRHAGKGGANTHTQHGPGI
ncbi:MAG: hypothetical protein ACTHJL_10310 [Amnibacterium sp.]